MKKIIILFTVLLLTGCGVGTTRNSKNNSQHHNIYMNTDSKCAGIKRVSKKYKETNPKDMLEKVDYCFIGKIKNFKDVEIYENGKIKTLMSISIESTIKGDVTGDIEIYRDGGRSGINEYVNYPKDTCLDKNKLKSKTPHILWGVFIIKSYCIGDILKLYQMHISKQKKGKNICFL